MLVLEFNEVLEYFEELMVTNESSVLFINFLNDCPVHTLIFDNRISFVDVMTRSDDMVEYLNKIWGKDHFNLKEATIRVEYLRHKV